jgi:3-dehydrosphinganine reductase
VGAGGDATRRGAAVVTGGSSGIGLAAALRLARAGHPVALIARRPEPLAAAAATIRREVPAARVSTHPLDVRDGEALAATAAAIAAEHGAIAWLVAAAGVVEPGLFVEQPAASHRTQIEINYLGTLNAVHAVVPAMRAAGAGRIVLVSSGAGLFGIYGYAAYAPSKFAVRGLAEVLRLELADHGISVTLACPPDTDTPQLAAERALRPAATAAIAAGGGVWSAEAVAATMLAGAVRGRFLVAPGLALGLLARLHSLIAPLLRLHQRRIVRALRRRRR